jgi:hypothetical protein
VIANGAEYRVASEPTTYPLLQMATNPGPRGSSGRRNVFTRYTMP